MNTRNWYGEHKRYSEKQIRNIDSEIRWTYIRGVLVLLFGASYFYFIILGKVI